ncbi:glycosyltransferase family 4 protein [Ekhidna sp. MALMAid0563]|uniref:glycosyltransferase family 4 protein n=1 Tax=Ekhidna sp. MALMAid0563 TaxID=3143937 RepID=UPI0032DE6BE1
MVKNISIILDSYLPDKRVEREAKALVEAGHNVSMFCFSKGDSYEIDGLFIDYFKPSFLVRKALAVAIDLPIYHWLLKIPVKKFIRKTKPDVIHVHDMTIAGLIFSLRNKEKIVLDLHENRPIIMGYYPHINKPLGKLLINLDRWKKAEHKYARLADRLILVTEEAKNDYKHLNQHITVLPNTIEKSEIEEVEFDDSIIEKFNSHFVITYVGDLGIRRGIFDALEAIKLLKDKIPSIKLVLVGDSSERYQYEAFVQSNALNKYVSFEGYQPHIKLFSYIKVSKIGISPLHRNRHHDTTYANKIFQYMAMGRCQIVSDCPAQKNVVDGEGAGLSYTSKKPAELAEAILRLYEDEGLRKQMEQKAQMLFKNKYNWEKMRTPLIDLYDSLD